MAAKFYAVLDTNVLVSAMYTGNPSAATRQILDLTLEGTITPLVNKEIVDEYSEVLSLLPVTLGISQRNQSW